VFFDARLALRSDQALFRQLEQLGERAAVLYDKPDAAVGVRGTKAVHTFSSVMCWAVVRPPREDRSAHRPCERASHWRRAPTR